MSKMTRTLVLCLCAAMALAGTGAFGAPKTYRFGVLAPITGVNAEYGKGFQIAMKMAADEINAKGEMKIELVVKDSKGDPKESADMARQFADDESILAILGDFTSSCCMANAPHHRRGGHRAAFGPPRPTPCTPR